MFKEQELQKAKVTFIPLGQGLSQVQFGQDPG